MNGLNNTPEWEENVQSTEPPIKDSKLKKLASFKIPWYLCALALILAVLITFMSTYSVLFIRFTADKNQALVQNSGEQLFDKSVIDALVEIYENYYVGKIGEFDPGKYLYLNMDSIKNWDRDTVTDALASLYVAHTGDKYGAYYSPSSMDELQNYFAGETVGIGVMITYDQDEKTFEVLYSMENSPAFDAGITAGDFIVGVDGKRVSDMSYEEVVNAIKGKEGTSVEITVLRGENEFTCKMERKAVVINTVLARMSSTPGVGIIRITEFTNETPEQFKKAVKQLREKGAENFVFDLRDNGGGTLEGVMGVLSYLLPKDTPLIKIVGKDGSASFDYAKSDENIGECKIAVLVNENTASAAELFTINIRDHKVGTIIGVKTFGKGVMQTFFNLPNGGMVKVTYKWYSSALSDNYDGVGIEPHIKEEMNEEFKNVNLFKIADEDDNQLQKALETLKQ